jgi:glycosyltransferase involved in cell wall biosynthesis
MNIGINLTQYSLGITGGMGVYVKSLLLELPNVAENDKFFIFCEDRHLAEFEQLNLELVVFRDYLRKNELLDQINYQIQAKHIDVWYCPLLEIEPLDCGVPAVVNIPDLQHEYHPEFFDQQELERRIKSYALSIAKADLVLTLSDTSKADITKYLHVADDKVKRVYLSAPQWFKNSSQSPSHTKKVLEKYKIKAQSYLFYPANTWPHKNHLRLIEAFKLVHDKYPELILVLTGYEVTEESIIAKKIKEYGLDQNIRFIGYIEDGEMPVIFNNAKILVYPTMFEGFGIPVLEAFITECPVVCSNLPVIKEVVGDAAIFFDPLDVEGMASAIGQVIDDKHIAQKLIAEGKKQAELFSAKKMAQDTVDALRSVYKGDRNYADIKVWPKISIVTPSYNHAKFIKKTIDSVLDQNYPNLEYVVMDGGSKDGTVEILKSYGDKIRWFSEKDKGQTDAINKGLKILTGDIVAYLNSDDTYEADALWRVAAYFVRNPQANFIQGKGRYIDAKGRYKSDYANQPATFESLHGVCSLCQPACFWRRSITDALGLFDQNFEFAMDYEYWIRIAKAGYKLEYLPIYLATSRDHKDTKTNSKIDMVYGDIVKINKRYYKRVHRDWILGYTVYKLPFPSKLNLLKLIGYYPLFVCLFVINSIRFNHELVSKDTLGLFMVWFRSQRWGKLKRIGVLRKLALFLLKVNLTVKSSVAFTFSQQPLKVKLARLYKHFFMDAFKYFEQIGILQQYPAKTMTVEQFPQLIAKQDDHKFLSFAIVTPSFNQGRFIKRTIDSVLDQNYPKLNYFVQDGASKDETVKVLQGYGDKLAFNSEKDSGQAEAINKGFAKLEGEIMAYINSDDVLLPGVLEYVNQYFQLHPEVDVVYGDRLIIDENDQEIGQWVLPPYDPEKIKYIDYIPQETLFWRREVWNKLNYGMDTNFRFALDWDLVTRLIAVGARFKHLPYLMGAFRYHVQQKTSSQMEAYGWQEFRRIHLHSLGKTIEQDMVGNVIVEYRKKSAVYAWLKAHGNRYG